MGMGKNIFFRSHATINKSISRLVNTSDFLKRLRYLFIIFDLTAQRGTATADVWSHFLVLSAGYQS